MYNIIHVIVAQLSFIYIYL